MNMSRAAHVLLGRIVSMLQLLPLHHGPLLSPCANFVEFGLCGCRTVRGTEDSGTESRFCIHNVWVIVGHMQESGRTVNILLTE